MNPNILNEIKTLDERELVKLRDVVNRVIKIKAKKALGRRSSPRIRVTLPATCEVEREREFFDHEHKITILDMSSNGLRFKAQNSFLKDDLLKVFFRSPSSGVKKKIDCQVLRVQEVKDRLVPEFQVAVKAVSLSEVRQYKHWLSKRIS